MSRRKPPLYLPGNGGGAIHNLASDLTQDIQALPAQFRGPMAVVPTGNRRLPLVGG